MQSENQPLNPHQPQSASSELQFLQLQTEANVLRARFSDALTESIRLQTLLALSQSDCNALRSENEALRQAVEKLSTVPSALPTVPTDQTNSNIPEGDIKHG